MRDPERIEMPQQARTHLGRIALAADRGVAGHITQSGHPLALRYNVDASCGHQRIAMPESRISAGQHHADVEPIAWVCHGV